MVLHISKISVQKIILISVTFSASLTLVMIARTNLIDFGLYVSNDLHLISTSTWDASRNVSLRISEYSTTEKSRNSNAQEWMTTDPRPMNVSFTQKEKTVSFEPSSKDTQKIYQESSMKSTCNDAATKRGPHQLVVAFSYYGEFLKRRNFFKGIEENAKLVKKYYPNWFMRVYTNVQPPLITIKNSERLLTETGITHSPSENRITVNEDCVCLRTSNLTKQEEMCHLECTYPWLDFCYVENIPGFGNLLKSQPQIWRFLPMADPLVDTFVSRDLDSRASEREAAAVQEWLSSNLSFHSMRDNPQHKQNLMGGMWGAVISTNRKVLSEKTKLIVEQAMKRTGRGQDQRFLTEILWPLAKGSVLQHDSYNCLMYAEHGNMKPWPSQRLQESYNFVGARVGVDKNPLSKQCPLSCRPADKPNWIYC